MDLNIGPFVPVFPPEVRSFYNLVLRTSAGVPPDRHLAPFGRPFGTHSVPFGAFVCTILH